MNPSNAAYCSHLLKHLPALSHDSDTQTRLRFLMDRVLALVLLDLEPARPLLQAGYSGRKGGQPPRDPVTMLRSLVLMMLCGITSINQWVARLQGAAELRALSGFNPQDKPPGVGTFYDFAYRLIEGPYQPRCQHNQGAAQQQLRGRRFMRQLEQEKAAQKAETQAEQAHRQQGRVKQLVDAALSRRDQPLPDDVSQRLNELLARCALVPSAALGLLGNLRRLKVAGDGTAIPSNADGNGQRECNCKSLGLSNCECPRSYSDPDAAWGYDSSRKIYFFGYRLHALCTRGTGSDLPLHISLEAANTPDVVMGVDALERLVKRLAQEDLQGQLWAAVYDAGYDAEAFYKMHRKLGIIPLIPLAQEVKTPTCAEGLRRDEQGTPLCKALMPMRLHQRDMGREQLVYNCPVKRPTRVEGQYRYVAREEECPHKVLCEPNSVLGPIVRIRLDGDPRMNLPIPRESEEFATMYKDRTCTERFNSTLKSKGEMDTGPYRRKHLTFVAAVLHGIGLHAQTWVEQTFAQRRPATVEELVAWCQRGAAWRQVA